MIAILSVLSIARDARAERVATQVEPGAHENQEANTIYFFLKQVIPNSETKRYRILVHYSDETEKSRILQALQSPSSEYELLLPDNPSAGWTQFEKKDAEGVSAQLVLDSKDVTLQKKQTALPQPNSATKCGLLRMSGPTVDPVVPAFREISHVLTETKYSPFTYTTRAYDWYFDKLNPETPSVIRLPPGYSRPTEY